MGKKGAAKKKMEEQLSSLCPELDAAEVRDVHEYIEAKLSKKRTFSQVSDEVAQSATLVAQSEPVWQQLDFVRYTFGCETHMGVEGCLHVTATDKRGVVVLHTPLGQSTELSAFSGNAQDAVLASLKEFAQNCQDAVFART